MVKTVEGKIQAKAINYAKARGVPSIRMYFGVGIRSGWPDVLFLIPGGRPLFIEFKKPGGKVKPVQEHKINILKEFV